MKETQEMWVWSQGQEDPLEKEMATHSNILAWKIPWTEEPGGLWSLGSQTVGHDWALMHTYKQNISMGKRVKYKKKIYTDIFKHIGK